MYKLTAHRPKHCMTWMRLGVIAVFLQAGTSIGWAQEFCAVSLHVSEADGKPITSTWIELVDTFGKVVRKEMMLGPNLKICDFGFGPHMLRVGVNECLPVTISNLRSVIGSPVSLNVVLNGCGYRETMRNACLIYFRVVDEGGISVPGATFSPSLTTQTPQTDSYGRYQGLFKGSHDIVFAAPGFSPTSVHLQCSTSEEVDQQVVLRRLP
jgi:hypothetical protein